MVLSTACIAGVHSWLCCVFERQLPFQRFYSEFGLFFYDKYGGSCVAVAWKPRAFIPHLFKVTVNTNYMHMVPTLHFPTQLCTMQASHVHCRSAKCYGNKDVSATCSIYRMFKYVLTHTHTHTHTTHTHTPHTHTHTHTHIPSLLQWSRQM